MITAMPGKDQCQRRITRGKRGDDGHLADLERTIQRKRAASIDKAGKESPGPRLPSGTVCKMSPTAEPVHGGGEEQKSDELHVKHGAERAHAMRSEEHTSELQSLTNLVCRLLLEKKNKKKQ